MQLGPFYACFQQRYSKKENHHYVKLYTFVKVKALFLKYQSVLWFLLIFIGSYVLLSLLYGYYLDYSEMNENGADTITRTVAFQSEQLLTDWGYDAQIGALSGYPGIQLYMNQEIVGQIVEGCNSVSIIILFVAFVLAFRQGWKKTVLFLFAGAILIYAINLVRIAILSIALHRFPEYQDFLHRVIFPGIIYGMVFILWVLWIRSIPRSKAV